MKTTLRNVQVLDCGATDGLRFQLYGEALDQNDTSRVASEFVCSTNNREHADTIAQLLNNRATESTTIQPWCQCEHANHCRPAVGVNLNHSYGAPCSKLIAVKTPFGTFHVCEACAKGCYAEYAATPEELDGKDNKFYRKSDWEVANG